MKRLKLKQKTQLALESAGAELLRMFLLSAVPILIVQLESGKFEWKLIVVAGLLSVLKSLDRFLHKNPEMKLYGGKEDGLLPF